MSYYKSFKPAFGLKNGHLQTLFSTFFKKQQIVKMEVEKFELEDGDFVECFWHNRPLLNDKKAIVLLFHGLEGSYESPYIQGVMTALEKANFASVLMHFRGCSGKDNRLARSYHSGDTGDAKVWIEDIVKRYPLNPLFAVGYSLGGNMLLKLLGEYGDLSPFISAVSVSAPMQLDICANRMNRGFSKIYQRHLMKHLKKSLLKKYKLHPMYSYIGIDENNVKKLKTFWEFDDVYTAPIHGFSSASDYYEKSSAKQFLKNIDTKTLIIQALDDPFMTPEILPNEDEISENIQMKISSHGGHVGFISGTIFKPTYYLEECIVDYFLKTYSDIDSSLR